MGLQFLGDVALLFFLLFLTEADSCLPRMITGGQGSVRGGAGPDVKSALRTADLRTHGVGSLRGGGRYAFTCGAGRKWLV